jgi:hypothetical protein
VLEPQYLVFIRGWLLGAKAGVQMRGFQDSSSCIWSSNLPPPQIVIDVAETWFCLAGLGDHKYRLRTLEVLVKDLELGGCLPAMLSYSTELQ